MTTTIIGARDISTIWAICAKRGNAHKYTYHILVHAIAAPMTEMCCYKPKIKEQLFEKSDLHEYECRKVSTMV